MKYFKSLIFHLKTLEKVLMKPTASRRKELIRLKEKFSEVQNRKISDENQ